MVINTVECGGELYGLLNNEVEIVPWGLDLEGALNLNLIYCFNPIGFKF